jgi:hypothetical protein
LVAFIAGVVLASSNTKHAGLSRPFRPVAGPVPSFISIGGIGFLLPAAEPVFTARLRVAVALLAIKDWRKRITSGGFSICVTADSIGFALKLSRSVRFTARGADAMSAVNVIGHGRRVF